MTQKVKHMTSSTSSGTAVLHVHRGAELTFPAMFPVSVDFALDDRIPHQARGILLETSCRMDRGEEISLSTPNMREALEELEAAGYAHREDGAWIMDDPVINWMSAEQVQRMENIKEPTKCAVTVLPSTPMTNIYAIAEKGTSAVKIGKAANVKKRLSGLQVGHRGELELLWSTAAPAQLEEHLHLIFEKRHIRGEWFSFPDGDAETLIGSSAFTWMIDSLEVSQ